MPARFLIQRYMYIKRAVDRTTYLNMTLSFFLPLSCDAAYPWQIGFQDGSTPTFEGIVELHDTIFFYLIVISFLVFWMLATTISKFSSSKVGIVHKYTNHGTLLELI
jgi:cytochrome c oxidase subunit 2